MPLPSNFNPTDHMRSVAKKVHNPRVRAFFADIDEDDITTGKTSAKTACIIKDSDSIPIITFKMLLFDNIFNNKEVLIPEREFTGVRRKRKPQVKLTFRSQGSDPIWGYISFRIMNESSESFSTTKAKSLANKIKSTFGMGNGKSWNKGIYMFTYSTWDLGYQLQLLCATESEAKDLIRDVLDLQGHVPDWEFMNKIENAEPTQAFRPDTMVVMGETVQSRNLRPTVTVYFQHATLRLWPNQPIILFDRSGRHFNALVD